jgi:hypothetical protein
MGTGGSFPRVIAAGGMKLTTHLDLVLRPGMVELYLHFPIGLSCMVLN